MPSDIPSLKTSYWAKRQRHKGPLLSPPLYIRQNKRLGRSTLKFIFPGKISYNQMPAFPFYNQKGIDGKIQESS